MTIEAVKRCAEIHEKRLRNCEDWIMVTDRELTHVSKWREGSDTRLKTLETFMIQVKFIVAVILFFGTVSTVLIQFLKK